MGVTERRIREKEELRAKIMDAATELFVKEGRQSVSIRKIAEKIEYAPSTIYLYFEDKNQLIMKIVTETFERLEEQLDAVEKQNLPPVEALEAGIRVYIRFGLEHPNHYYLAFCTLPETPELTEDCREALEAGLAALGSLARALTRCMEAGYIPPQDIQVLTQTVWVMIHGLTSSLIYKAYDEGFPWASDEQLIEKTMSIIKNGILRPDFSKN